MTNEQVITRIKHNSMYKDDRETADYIIKALEQQPSDDCVSRAEMLKYQQYLQGKMPNEENYKLWKFIKDLPPVTPTHGTCKDCKYLLRDNPDCFCCRISWRRMTNENFYCENYEKREGEVAKMTYEIWEERKNPPIDGKTDF